MSVTFTTDLPDAQQPSLGNGVEDEIAVDWTDLIDYGEYDLQVRETGASTWNDWDSLDDTVQSDIITGREDGEEYEVRMRTRTEHVTGAWSTPVSIVTLFPAAINFSVDAVTQTDADLSWDDQSDNEDGFRLERRRLYDAGWGPWREVYDLAPNTVTATDPELLPGKQYEFRVVAYTEHTSAASNTDTATTTDSGLDPQRISASGYYAEIDHPSGPTLTLDIIAEATEWIPAIKQLPKIKLAVPKSPTWEESALEEQPLRVWKDGYRLPIDEVRSVGKGTEKDVIEGIGGAELDRHIEGVEYLEKEAHLAAQETIQANTSYATNVDDPASNPQSDIIFADVPNPTTFPEAIEGAPFAADEPVDLFDTYLRHKQVSELRDAVDDYTSKSGPTETIFTSAPGEGYYNKNQVMVMDTVGDTITFQTQFQHDIPADDVGLAFRYAMRGDDTNAGNTAEIPGLKLTITGPDNNTYTVFDVAAGALSGKFWEGDWRVDADAGTNLSITTLFAGETVAMTLEYTEAPSGEDRLLLDVADLFDGRYEADLTFANTFTGSGTSHHIDGPENYPSRKWYATETYASIQTVTGARLESSWNDISNDQAISVSNDAGTTWVDVTNSETADIDFGSDGVNLKARFGVDRVDNSSTYPAKGTDTQEISAFELYADMDDTPLLLDFSEHGYFPDVLNEMADAGDSIWEVRRDANGDYVVEWTQPGQRVSAEAAGLVDYSGRRTIEGSFQEVKVFGASYDIEAETFNQSSSTSKLGLAESDLVPGSETVYDVGSPNSTYERGIDYEIEYQPGNISILDGGSMAYDTDYSIDYEYTVTNTYSPPGVTDPRKTEVEVPDAATEREAGQVARAIVREVQDPLEEVRATIDRADPWVSLVEAIDPDQLPFDGPLRIKKVETSPGQIEQILGSRKEISEEVEDIRTQLRAVSRRV